MNACQRLKGVVDRLCSEISAVLWETQRNASSFRRPLLLLEDSADVCPAAVVLPL